MWFNYLKRKNTAIIVIVLLFSEILPSYAYTDPGITGMFFQLGYIIFYGAIALVCLLFKPFKILLKKIANKIFGGK